MLPDGRARSYIEESEAAWSTGEQPSFASCLPGVPVECDPLPEERLPRGLAGCQQLIESILWDRFDYLRTLKSAVASRFLALVTLWQVGLALDLFFAAR